MKPLTVEDRLAAWAAQGPYRVTDAQIAFIAAMRIARSAGAGYGWMRTVVGWEWEHADPGGGHSDESIFNLGCSQGEASGYRLLLDLEWIRRVGSPVMPPTWECPSCHAGVAREGEERPSRECHISHCDLADALNRIETSGEGRQ